MATAARRRLRATARAVLGGAAGGLFAAFAPAGCDSGESGLAWGSSYLARGALEPSIIGDRKTMNANYVADVRRLRGVVPKCPEHVPLLEQAAYTSGGSAVLRVLTWNINILCGPDGSASVGSLQRIDPDLVADVVQEANADVVCLQEALDWVPPKYREYLEKQGVGDVAERMQRLNCRLEEQGYRALLRSCSPPSCGNPVLVASRVPLVHSETLELAVPESKAIGMDAPRSAAYVEIGVASGRDVRVGLYATHLHHINQSPQEGQRAAEIRSLLEHHAARPALEGRLATLLTGDLNQPRQRDYTEAEWQVVEAGLRGVKQPIDDGVSEALRRAGFVCAYDVRPMPRTNFGAGRPAPAFTHWTGTAVDYLFLQQERHEGGSPRASLVASHTLLSDLSDHLPLAFDLALALPPAPLPPGAA
uniref:Endonuclease/exonuclease/phosphatase domain-containing protein n=1 Tax=Alexandrium monilatum TaxID=311494 RepID=A0A7S4RXM4_9DINO|mmetsp:Transcript_48659/g.152963  ORF Transcript_48659/g.152963 Transcript_48659/m.152963 type:complete len:420 (+) Transcript_48659:68-1327(+)